jgi:pseudouridine-5'-phosphate glycosidase
MTAPLTIETTPEVKDALSAGRPVVALESTIITHGMPWPGNRDMALEVEAVIARKARFPPPSPSSTAACMRASTRRHRSAGTGEGRDEALARRFRLCAGGGRTGGTTVAATMMAAHLAGISGLRHRRHRRRAPGRGRRASTSPPISTSWPHPGDRRLRRRQGHSRHPQDARGAGDPRRPRCRLRPGRNARLLVARLRPEGPSQARHAGAIARFEVTRRALGGHGGMLIANPVPVDDEIPAPEMNRHIAAALRLREGKGNRGQGRHAVPAGRDPRPDRWRKPQDQHRAGAQQCPPRRPDRHGPRFGKVMSLRRARQPTARITL